MVCPPFLQPNCTVLTSIRLDTAARAQVGDAVAREFLTLVGVNALGDLAYACQCKSLLRITAVGLIALHAGDVDSAELAPTQGVLDRVKLAIFGPQGETSNDSAISTTSSGATTAASATASSTDHKAPSVADPLSFQHGQKARKAKERQD